MVLIVDLASFDGHYEQAVFNTSDTKQGTRDTEFYMSYYQKGAETEKGYVHSYSAVHHLTHRLQICFD